MSAFQEFQPGSIVSARGREWIVLPESDGPRLHLRSLGGADDDVIVIHALLEREPPKPATFPLPEAAEAQRGTQGAALLMRDALLLKLRAGAGPFRALGRINVEPRAYQLVPLLMALKHEVIRLLIADDVGIGKTIEAGLIAREMLDRGEIQRFTVLCPPHLCEQWQEELQRKFNIRAEVVTTGTVERLERGLQTHTSIFSEYPFTVVSLDYIKSDRRRDEFQNACPELVIVDEAHTCAEGISRGKHQRYRLLRALADNAERHLVLLTATPHSGNEDAYYNLLGLLNRVFVGLKDVSRADHPLYKRLGDHLVQRRRIDISEWQDNTRFPLRETAEKTYQLSGAWGALFNDVLDYARELVREAEGLNTLHQRLNWWAALALLRCISSSPAAAVRALQTRLKRAEGEGCVSDADQLAEIEAQGINTVLDGSSEQGLSSDDIEPGAVVEEDAERLRSLIDKAASLAGANDPKLQQLIVEVRALVEQGFKPVVFCRYIATAHYVAAALQPLFKDHEVISVTGELSPGEREEKILALRDIDKTAIMVATDCLSEGINLQDVFDAVVHYDLSWNPTRHEQREGRVDRFGQRSNKVRALMLYGADNPVDGAVLQVILRKAESIRKALGISVPMPEDETRISQAIMQTVLLTRDEMKHNLSLDFGFDSQQAIEDDLDSKWQNAQDKARRNQTIFAQRALKPEDVIPEFARMSEVLGHEADVRRFVTAACQALNAPLGQYKQIMRLPYAELPEPLRDRLAQSGIDSLRNIDFSYPPAGLAEHIHRTHPLVAGLADQLAEEALKGDGNAAASRAGAWFTRAVTLRTAVLLVRLRTQLTMTRASQRRELLAEEAIAIAVSGQNPPQILTLAKLLALMQQPVSRNMAPEMRQRQVEQALEQVQVWQPALDDIARQRANELLKDHRRVRDAAKAKGTYDVYPQLPVDVVGLYVLMPDSQLI
ncbi:TPA: helicase-related protein [Pseudomonas aeruginosa]|uniref:helicase-related protein n=1 Tax=Pseudomonas aeruginosa TaxID=287 RepID=UPI000F8396E7|nr:helicase-related protein [Pseudomonas aeruginosa]ELK4870637.1 DEAD/DEAH box helicase family protein [Pseudomonas aeruginosa]MBG4151979.1 DEAD/DEAH box helicase family protein [Pseudomonas aeruginosa]MBG4169107.1 DEAD/DEAH box helicase family protein [Pseudomonas aeruginosa]MBG4487633.1 DEAD/DEAH box helicase family protein [Pseudomonas aeruginosa]MBG4500320.1 DEAD/DEAH box helicase family protein [Pseudomonas aeruginosa]